MCCHYLSRVLVLSLIIAFPSIGLSQAPPTFRIVIEDTPASTTSEMIKVIEEKGLNARNAIALNLLFAGTNLQHIDQCHKSRSASLRIATAWHLVLENAIVATRLNRIEQKYGPVTPDISAIDNFVKSIEKELGCDLPSAFVAHFREVRFEHGHLFSGLQAIREQPNFKYLGRKWPKSLPFRSNLAFDEGNTMVFAGDAKCSTLAIHSKEGPIAQRYENGVLRWSSKLRNRWSEVLRYGNYHFAIAECAESKQLLVLVACHDRFSINMISIDNGVHLWEFCTDWPALD